jgi:hypothetical protein
MASHPQQDTDSHRNERCSAQDQEHKQNLDHHRLSGYQMELLKFCDAGRPTLRKGGHAQIETEIEGVIASA